MGEDIVQRWIIELLRPLVERWLEAQGQFGFVGADQFIYFKQFDPHQRVAPDVYVLPGVAPKTEVRSWKAWETGIVPSFAFEVASRDWEKDYVRAPLAHEALGTSELIVFDPSHESRRDGVRWQRFSRSSGKGLRLSERTNLDRIYSEALGCFLRSVGEKPDLRIRIGTGPAGDVLFPTAVEAEHEAREAALARVAELEARLAELEASKR